MSRSDWLGMKSRLLRFDAASTEKLRIAEQPGALRNLAILFAHSGDSWFWLLGLAVLWWWGSQPWKQRALWMGASILATAAVVMLVKVTIRRQRPAGEWGAFYRKTDPHSFPSGHAARAALLAALAVGWGPTWFGLLLLAWAPLVILARVAMGLHYFSDVLAGALLGLIMGWVILVLLPPLSILF